MNKLLSICIPTYNRAIEFDRQLAWLSREVRGFESECEVIVSDNCSADDTQAVIAKWQSAFHSVPFRVNRNAENIGWMRNFVCCYQAAEGKYTWIVGDDDLVYDGTLANIIHTLRSRPTISLMYLNFSGRHKNTGEVIGEHWFDTDFEEQDFTEGQAVFQRCIAKNIGSVIFITSAICRTDLVRVALQKWPESVNNWGGVAFWYGYCALHGEVWVTRKNYVECAMGVSYWQKDPRAWFRIRHRDIPEVYLKLQSIGYPLSFCRGRIVDLLREDFIGEAAIENIKDYLRSFKRWPTWTTSVALSFLVVVGGSFVSLGEVIDPKEPESEAIHSLGWSFSLPSLRLVLMVMLNTLPGKIQRKLVQAAQIPAELNYRAELARYASKLPALNPTDRHIVETCHREGVCVTSLDALGLGETVAMLAGADMQLAEMENLLPIAAVSNRIAATGKPAHPQIFTVTDLPEFDQWGSSTRMLAIAENYIGLPAAFQGVHLRRDFANPNPITTELWHQDLEDRRILKVIVYLTQVDENTGPFEYIPKSEMSPLLAWRIHKGIGKLQRLGIDDATMQTFVPRPKWKTCPGPRGTVVFVDPKNVFHHGRSRRRERAALFFVYTAQQPLRPEHCTQYSDATFARPNQQN